MCYNIKSVPNVEGNARPYRKYPEPEDFEIFVHRLAGGLNWSAPITIGFLFNALGQALDFCMLVYFKDGFHIDDLDFTGIGACFFIARDPFPEFLCLEAVCKEGKGNDGSLSIPLT